MEPKQAAGVEGASIPTYSKGPVFSGQLYKSVKDAPAQGEGVFTGVAM